MWLYRFSPQAPIPREEALASQIPYPILWPDIDPIQTQAWKKLFSIDIVQFVASTPPPPFGGVLRENICYFWENVIFVIPI